MSLFDKLFGTKSDRDLKVIMPYVAKIKAEYAKLQDMSNDELRAQTHELRKQILQTIASERHEIDKLKETAEQTENIIDREEFYDKIDKIEEIIDEKLETSLKDALPRAFAIVKDTARRFKENSEIVVTANDFDKDLAASKDTVIIQGDKAIFKNSWLAGGNTITWDMLHYDVQLIGGIVLHDGKIAEMATGEGKTLVATLPVFLNALPGRGVHLVTVNDY